MYQQLLIHLLLLWSDTTHFVLLNSHEANIISSSFLNMKPQQLSTASEPSLCSHAVLKPYQIWTLLATHFLFLQS